MNIAFPADAPRFSEKNLTVIFRATVDGKPVECAVSVEALEDHFGVESIDEAGWIHAFSAGREQIVETAREHLLIHGGASVLLKSGHFRNDRSPPAFSPR